MSCIARAAHQLGFFVGSRLEAHSAKDALPLAKRHVALRDVQVWPVLLKFPLTECLGEKAALIILPFQLNNECTLQFCLRQDQCSWLPCSGRAQRSTSSRLG